MILNLKGAAIIAATLLSTIGAANANQINVNQTLNLTIGSSNSPLIFDFGTVSAGLSNTYAGVLQVSFFGPGDTASIVPLINGLLGSCPSALVSGSTCSEAAATMFTQLPSTAAGIYSGQHTYDFLIKNAVGAIVADDSVTVEWTINVGAVAVPGPTAGAGALSFALAALFLGGLVRRRGHQMV
jgi:hypothetical protein